MKPIIDNTSDAVVIQAYMIIMIPGEVMNAISINFAMVYCESVNLIGSFTVFHLLIDNSCEKPMKIVLLSILTNHEALNF